MTEEEIHKIAALEMSHWWYRGTRDICFAVLAPYLANQPLRMLDVGCGTGGNLLRLTRFGHARGVDIDPLCVEYCRRKGLVADVASMFDLRVPHASLDLVTFFDVLDQADPADTVAVLSGVADALVPGGLLAMREPAMPIAAGAHDAAVNARQRFTTSSMKAALTRAGFETLRITYFNTFLFPPIALLRTFQRSAMPSYVASDVRPTPEPLNHALLALLWLEMGLLRMVNLPFGVSIFAVARKRHA